MSISLTVALVTGDDGRINQDASVEAFRSALVRRTAELETEEVQIAQAVNDLFDQYMGTSINVPAVCSMAAQKLNVQPENFATISERVASYVRSHSQETKNEDGTTTDVLLARQDGMGGTSGEALGADGPSPSAPGAQSDGADI